MNNSSLVSRHLCKYFPFTRYSAEDIQKRTKVFFKIYIAVLSVSSLSRFISNIDNINIFFFFGSDRSPRREDLGTPSVCDLDLFSLGAL